MRIKDIQVGQELGWKERSWYNAWTHVKVLKRVDGPRVEIQLLEPERGTYRGNNPAGAITIASSRELVPWAEAAKERQEAESREQELRDNKLTAKELVNELQRLGVEAHDDSTVHAPRVVINGVGNVYELTRILEQIVVRR